MIHPALSVEITPVHVANGLTHCMSENQPASGLSAATSRAVSFVPVAKTIYRQRLALGSFLLRPRDHEHIAIERCSLI